MKESEPIVIVGLTAEQVLNLIQKQVNKGANGRDMRLLAGTLAEPIPINNEDEDPVMTQTLTPGMRLWGVLVV